MPAGMSFCTLSDEYDTDVPSRSYPSGICVSSWNDVEDDSSNVRLFWGERADTAQILSYLERKIITAEEAERMLYGEHIDIEDRLKDKEPKQIRVINTD